MDSHRHSPSPVQAVGMVAVEVEVEASCKKLRSCLGFVAVRVHRPRLTNGPSGRVFDFGNQPLPGSLIRTKPYEIFRLRASYPVESCENWSA
jgi:hypothetical protein